MQHKERAIKEEEEVQPITRAVTKAPVKTEADDETPKPDNDSALKCRSNGLGRSRHNLITTCGLAREAIKLLREHKDGFDIVISSVNMPDMDSFKLLRLIWRDTC